MSIGTITSTTSSDGGGPETQRPGDWHAVVGDLGPTFIARAAVHAADDSFVVENYRELKEYGLFSAAVPIELGGGGATHRELCALMREMAQPLRLDRACRVYAYAPGGGYRVALPARARSRAPTATDMC